MRYVIAFLIAVLGCVRTDPQTVSPPPNLPLDSGHDKLIVFVHGFTGSGEKTWGLFPKLLREDSELKGVDVYVWDYPTLLLKRNPSIEDIGQALRTALVEQFPAYKSIYLVGHSMGGLVLQSMVTEELKHGRANNLKRIKHLIFFGTPNRGAQVPELLKRNMQLEQLSIKSSFVESLLNEWVNRVYNPDIQPGDENSKLRIPVTAVAGQEDRFVTPDSAKSFFWNPPPSVVPGDHSTMKEPPDRHAPAYAVVKNRILEQSATSGSGQNIPSDLSITPLTGSTRLLPLDGHRVIISASQTLYPVGAKVSFTLTHNKRSTHSIIVKGLSLNLHRYSKDENRQLAYEVQGDEIYGAGSTAAHEFSVSLKGNHVGPARWVVRDKEKSQRAVTAKSANFFDYDGVAYLTLRADSDDLEEVRGTITTQEPGTYELSFAFSYSVGGVDRTSDTAKFIIYRKE